MKKITADELKTILELHKKWLAKQTDGVRANLHKVDLSEADLTEADLRWANLSGDNLIGADLRWVDLSEADLTEADLCWANLSGADLRGADLRGANLRWAILRWADLSGADLSGANLSMADLREANVWEVKGLPPICCPEKGSFVGFKKCPGLLGDCIVELEITEGALRSSATTRKCRCSKAKVLSITNLDGSPYDENRVFSKRDPSFEYAVGKTVEVSEFDTDRWNECSSGIHFFITREEAVSYTLY